MTDIQIHQGSILDCDVDAIVNPANSFLNHGGGLARVIDYAARGLSSEPRRIRWAAEIEAYNAFSPGLIPVGGAAMSPPGALSQYFKHIIHAVGPIWGGGAYQEAWLLWKAYDSAITLAEEAGLSSLALPAISAGIFGCPIGNVAVAAVRNAQATYLDKVVFALMDDAHVAAFENELRVEC